MERLYIAICNIFTAQIKGFAYAIYISGVTLLGVLHLSTVQMECGTTSHWNVRS